MDIVSPWFEQLSFLPEILIGICLFVFFSFFYKTRKLSVDEQLEKSEKPTMVIIVLTNLIAVICVNTCITLIFLIVYNPQMWHAYIVYLVRHRIFVIKNIDDRDPIEAYYYNSVFNKTHTKQEVQAIKKEATHYVRTHPYIKFAKFMAISVTPALVLLGILVWVWR